MSKLFELKPWLTLEEAAKHLSSALAEPVVTSDVLHLTIEGHLRLSTNLISHTRVHLGKVVQRDAANLLITPACPSDFADPDRWVSQFSEPPPQRGRKQQNEWLRKNSAHEKEWCISYCGRQLGKEQVIEFARDESTITGVWDLTMEGAEKRVVKEALHEATGGSGAGTTVLFSLIILVDEGGEIYAAPIECPSFEFVEEDDEKMKFTSAQGIPSHNLPEHALFVVRPAALSEFLATLVPKNEKKLDTRERTSLLSIIGALAHHAKLDLGKHNKAGHIVEGILKDMGVTLSAHTIGNHLKAVREAMDSRKI